MPSLENLLSEAGGTLTAVTPFDGTRDVTGVHVSELADPGRYLDGGEMLLTTGIPLTGDDRDADYLDRVRTRGVAAIGLGLGEGWDAPPTRFIELCRTADVALFVVPVGAPFLAVSRAFWRLAAQEDRATVARTAHAHTGLARAAAADDPLSSILRHVAEGVGGWTAWVPFDTRIAGGVVHPASSRAVLRLVTADVDRSIRQSGAASASFAAEGSVVVAHAVIVEGRAAGALAVGVPGPSAGAHRALTLTAVALLGLVFTAQLQQHSSAARWMAALAFDGEASAARALARSARIALPAAFRVLATVTEPPVSAGHLTVRRGDLRLTMVEEDGVDAVEYGALTLPVPLEEVPVAAVRASTMLSSTAVGRLVVEDERRADGWRAALERGSPGILETVHAYLRHGQRIESAARALGVHRNTVRERLATAERAAEITLSDPDVTAELWLSLRAAGHGRIPIRDADSRRTALDVG